MPIVIHSAAKSSGKYFDRRQLTRNTWAKEAREHKMRPMFVIGLPEDNQTQVELIRESDKYKDIIQFGFIDNYYNLTLKALSVLRWLTKNCKTSDYVLKTDDDVLVNVPLLVNMINEKQFADGLTGKMMFTRSNRRWGHKWFMPQNVYKSSFYEFLFGFSYVMSKSSIKRMYKTAKNFTGPVLDIDDLFMTGVLAREARVRLYNNRKFRYYCGTNACRMHDMIAIHGCDSVEQTAYVWNVWKNMTVKECQNRRSRFDFDFYDFGLSIDFEDFR